MIYVQSMLPGPFLKPVNTNGQHSYSICGYYGKAEVHFRGTFREVIWRQRFTHEMGSKVIPGSGASADAEAFRVSRQFVDADCVPSRSLRALLETA